MRDGLGPRGLAATRRRASYRPTPAIRRPARTLPELDGWPSPRPTPGNLARRVMSRRKLCHQDPVNVPSGSWASAQADRNVDFAPLDTRGWAPGLGRPPARPRVPHSVWQRRAVARVAPAAESEARRRVVASLQGPKPRASPPMRAGGVQARPWPRGAEPANAIPSPSAARPGLCPSLTIGLCYGDADQLPPSRTGVR
jgi:hypothetical protein